MTLSSAVPVLQVSDVCKSVQWYKDILGFDGATFPRHSEDCSPVVGPSGCHLADGNGTDKADIRRLGRVERIPSSPSCLLKHSSRALARAASSRYLQPGNPRSIVAPTRVPFHQDQRCRTTRKKPDSQSDRPRRHGLPKQYSRLPGLYRRFSLERKGRNLPFPEVTRCSWVRIEPSPLVPPLFAPVQDSSSRGKSRSRT